MWPFKSNVEVIESPVERRAAQFIQAVRAADMLQNQGAGLGTTRDKRMGSEFSPKVTLNRMQLEALWSGSWHVKKGIKAPVDDAFAEGISVQWDGSDKDTDRQQKFDEWDRRFEVDLKLHSVNYWARLYGWATIIIGLKGEKDLSKPLDVSRIRRNSVDWLYVIDRWRCGPQELMDQASDLPSPNFGKPRYFSLGSAAVPTSRVHWTRCIQFIGEELPWFAWLANGMFPDSSIQHVYEDVRDHGSIMALMATMFFEANVDVLAIAKLAETLALPGGEQQIKDRFKVVAEQKGINRMLLVDANDKYERKAANMQGWAAIVDHFHDNLIGAFDIPATRFYGRSPGGFNSTGDGDMDNYRKRLKGDQKSKYQAQVSRFNEIKAMDLFGEIPPGFKTEFNPLDQETKAEKSTRELAVAQARKIYFDMGAITAKLVARQLKEDDEMSAQEDADVNAVKEVSEVIDPNMAAQFIAGMKKKAGSNGANGKALPPTGAGPNPVGSDKVS
jgi:phage-related protein (TIGR01555 family)